MSEKAKDTYNLVLKALSNMRTEKASLGKASQEAGVSPKTVKRWAGSRLEKRNGRITAKPTDQWIRPMKIPTAEGPREILVRGSRQASLLGSYWANVHEYLAKGGISRIAKFSGKSIKDATGAELPLITDPTVLRRLGNAGVIRFEQIYNAS
jgi:hypothetical protein